MMERLVGRVPAPLRIPVGSLLVSARRRELCVARPTGDGWAHSYREGITVHPRLGGPSARLQDAQARDTFLYNYEPVFGDVIFDVGAGVGGEVRLLSRLVGRTGRVISVEAHPRTYGYLVHTIRLNGLDNVTPVQAALAGVTGTVYLSDDAENHVSNGLVDRHSFADGAGGIAVRGCTLPDLVDSTGVDRIDLLKMNIEGAELAVLRAAEGCLDRVRNVAISCHDFKADETGEAWQRTYAPIRELLQDNGFTLKPRRDDPRGWIWWYVYGQRQSSPRSS
jgi:FkbM family methyltransferase